jgi:hypothetical protein
MRRLLPVIGGLLVLSACGGTPDSSGPRATATVTEKATVTATATATETPAAKPTTAAPEPAAGGDTFTMPNEVGKPLQDAQDDLQAISGDILYVSKSTDATGAGRLQILDSQWKVCSQNVAAGTTVGPRDLVRFAVVRLAENCP